MHQTREKHHDVLESRQNVHEMLQAEKKLFFLRGGEDTGHYTDTWYDNTFLNIHLYFMIFHLVLLVGLMLLLL